MTVLLPPTEELMEMMKETIIQRNDEIDQLKKEIKLKDDEIARLKKKINELSK